MSRRSDLTIHHICQLPEFISRDLFEHLWKHSARKNQGLDLLCILSFFVINYIASTQVDICLLITFYLDSSGSNPIKLTAELESVTDLLSSGAVEVEKGQRVIINNWGGDHLLEGVVERAEPFGFTKDSALSIEEQRVNVITDFTSPREEWARIVLWDGMELFKLPLTALFRDGSNWAVFVDDNGDATKRNIKLGRRTGLEAEVIDGLKTGERIVVHPSDKISQGVSIESRIIE